ncbi:hypothetical protein IW262DRAFT_385369 [Armillaria fumosa]|nr:hypothetical protein IW262DRAFT_385369 [Armillaria fumosa]
MTTKQSCPQFVVFPQISRWRSYSVRGKITDPDPVPRKEVYGFNVFAIREGPWHLGQVCRSWRNVIETLCPELWANMSVEIPWHEVSLKADAALEVLRIILERSRNHPLDFHLVYNYYPNPPEKDGISQAMERCFHMMVAHSKRWRVVEMMLDSDILPQHTLSSVERLMGSETRKSIVLLWTRSPEI